MRGDSKNYGAASPRIKSRAAGKALWLGVSAGLLAKITIYKCLNFC
jgi:hypothetical protein